MTDAREHIGAIFIMFYEIAIGSNLIRDAEFFCKSITRHRMI